MLVSIKAMRKVGSLTGRGARAGSSRQWRSEVRNAALEAKVNGSYPRED